MPDAARAMWAADAASAKLGMQADDVSPGRARVSMVDRARALACPVRRAACANGRVLCRCYSPLEGRDAYRRHGNDNAADLPQLCLGD